MEGQPTKTKEEKHMEIFSALGELERAVDSYRRFRDRIQGVNQPEKQTEKDKKTNPTLLEILDLTPTLINNACVELADIRKALMELLF